MIDLGTVRPGSTVRIPFSSFDKDDGSSVTMSGFAVGDILIYKDGSVTERASTAGFAATTDFDSKTGKHITSIDLADNTTAGFFNAGSEYLVAVDAVTIDGVSTGGWIGRFRVGYPGALLDTTLATLSTQTSFTLTVGPAEDDALNGCQVVLHDIASAVQLSHATVLDYTGASKTVTLEAAPTFTIAAGDNISLMPPSTKQTDMTSALASLSAILALSTSQYSRTGTAQAGAASTITLDASASASNDYYNYQLVLLVSGTGAGQARFITAYVGATKVATMNRNWVTNPDSTSVFVIFPFDQVPGASAPTAAQVADAVWDELRGDHTTSGTFGQGVVTNSLAPDSITATAIAADAIGSSELAAAAAAEIATAVRSELAVELARVDAAVTTRATPAQVNTEVVDVITVDVLADSVATDGTRPTVGQALLMIARFLQERSVSGTTVTVKKEDGSTTSMTFTLNDATSPTSITRNT